MGKEVPSGIEEARTLVAGQFNAVGQSDAKRFRGPFNVSIWGVFTGSVSLERSFDGGGSWIELTLDAGGAPAAFTGPVSFNVDEVEPGVLYRLNCTALSAGAASYRLAQ